MMKHNPFNYLLTLYGKTGEVGFMGRVNDESMYHCDALLELVLQFDNIISKSEYKEDYFKAIDTIVECGNAIFFNYSYYDSFNNKDVYRAGLHLPTNISYELLDNLMDIDLSLGELELKIGDDFIIVDEEFNFRDFFEGSAVKCKK